MLSEKFAPAKITQFNQNDKAPAASDPGWKPLKMFFLQFFQGQNRLDSRNPFILDSF